MGWDGGMVLLVVVARLSLAGGKKREGVSCGGLYCGLRLRMDDCEIPI